MEVKIWQTSYRECTPEELNATERALAEAARKATFTAYAPYSHFCVGAAALLSNGEIVSGSNQENASSPAGVCAERCAVEYAQARFPKAAICMLAIAARPANSPDKLTGTPISPCGICRQVLMEAERRSGTPLRLLLTGELSVYIVEQARLLLPLPFEG